MKKINILIILLIITVTNSFGQNKQTDTMDYLPKIKELHKTVKTYDYAPEFQLWAWSSDCYFEILINDIPIIKWYKNSGSAGNRMPITEILKSGAQNITIKIYPPEGQEKLSDRVKLEMKIVERTEGMAIDDEKVLFEFKTKQNLDEYEVETFAHKGLPYYEKQAIFKAEVPYELTGWSDSKDLTKIKIKELTKQVIDAYTSYGTAIQNSNLEQMAKTLYTKEQEIAQAWYFNTKESSESRWADYEGISNRNEKKIQPLENFKLNLYGNGRVVAIERIDTKYRGKSALMLKYKNEEDQKRISFFGVFLHIPKGGNKLEVIR